MSSLPTGQYIPGRSVLHRLDARAKISSFFLLLAATVATANIPGYAFLFSFSAGLIFLSGLPLRAALGSIQRLWLFFILIFLMNALFFDNTQALWSWRIFCVSRTGIIQGANVVLRLALLIVLSNILTCTTASLDLAAALESLMKPLKLIRIPVEEVAMILSVAIQFIPTLLEEADLIKKAQIARGARFESKRLTERAASFVPLVVPIFLAAFRRADELSLAMEARGYRGARNRTQRKREPLRWGEFAALAGSAVVCLVQLYLLGN